MIEISGAGSWPSTGASLAGSSLALMGFSPSVALAEVREFKLAARHGDAQHLSVLCRGLRHHHVRAG